jgi:hypothetical protein
MPMRRTVLFAIGGLMLAGIIHITTVMMVPLSGGGASLRRS